MEELDELEDRTVVLMPKDSRVPADLAELLIHVVVTKRNAT
jgi:hypothetical protein